MLSSMHRAITVDCDPEKWRGGGTWAVILISDVWPGNFYPMFTMENGLGQDSDLHTVDSRYLEVEGTL